MFFSSLQQLKHILLCRTIFPQTTIEIQMRNTVYTKINSIKFLIASQYNSLLIKYALIKNPFRLSAL